MSGVRIQHLYKSHCNRIVINHIQVEASSNHQYWLSKYKGIYLKIFVIVDKMLYIVQIYVCDHTPACQVLHVMEMDHP